MLAVAIDLNVLFVWCTIPRRPVREQYLRSPLCRRIVARVDGQGRRRRDPSRDVNHGLIAPPALALESERTRGRCAIEQTGVVSNCGPLPRFAKIIDPAP